MMFLVVMILRNYLLYFINYLDATLTKSLLYQDMLVRTICP